MIKLPQITDMDIGEIIELLGKDFSDPERQQVLQCMETRDIQACPGSGKTTALAAKLAILSKKVGQNYGICVLSHTNVAKDQIRTTLAELGGLPSQLLRYPHFIGTIQSFVDRFLAIPAMLELHNVRPRIDDGTFADIALDIPLSKRAERWLEHKTRPNTETVRSQLVYKYGDIGRIAWFDGGQEQCYLTTPNSGSYKELFSLKERVTANGCIQFHDAYSFADYYLQVHSEIIKAISSRFPLVFIDEMQDTSKFQWDILRRAFSTTSLFQCFGDQNQAIYSSASADTESAWEVRDPLFINTSYRLSASIASLAADVCIEPHEITSSAEHQECEHCIMIFDDESKHNVLSHFAELIIEQRLPASPYPYKAIGWVTHHDTQLGISDYYRSYNRRHSSRSQPSMLAYFELARIAVANGNIGQASRYIIEGLVKFTRLQQLWHLREDGTRGHYTPTTLISSLEARESDNALKRQIIEWCEELSSGSISNTEILRDQIANLLTPLGEIKNYPEKALRFLTDTTVLEEEGDQTGSQEKNIYIHETGIRVVVDTIHGVKGETHQATLLLDTFYKANHLVTLLPWLTKQPPDKLSQISRKGLPLAYVAMTRPTHLLCLAMPKQEVPEEAIGQLQTCGWTIRDITTN